MLKCYYSLQGQKEFLISLWAKRELKTSQNMCVGFDNFTNKLAKFNLYKLEKAPIASTVQLYVQHVSLQQFELRWVQLW